MPNHLITGVPGAGKTLYAISRVVKPLVGTVIDGPAGTKVCRRIMVGGVRDLLIEHEPIDVPTFEPDTGKLVFAGKEFQPETDDRRPGEPPHDCERRADNWWRWCEPGDVIVIDECQRLFRPMPSGRKLPKFITMLETHRHYGVDFVFITQHPQLLHSNVRNLINLHNDVRRVFGSHQTIVYEWDRCSSPDKIKTAASKLWRHDKKAYSLYKSAEVHTKQKHKLPVAIYVLVLCLVAVPASLYAAKERIWRDRVGQAQETTTAATASPASGAVAASFAPSKPDAAASAAVPASAASEEVVVVKFAGCISMPGKCECIDVGGVSQVVDLGFCEANARRSGMAIPYVLKGEAASTAMVRETPTTAKLTEAAPMGGSISLGGNPRAHILSN